ncbi:tyrosine-type recombinase/integrase [Pseudomonas koreensis]|uniref:tyrosine-type recombinase/integrase n=1 Tax=Pseudomonas koreensis TaxID=198620 RepID=UPI003F839F6E
MVCIIKVNFESSADPRLSQVTHQVPQLFYDHLIPASEANRYLRFCCRTLMVKSLYTVAEHLKELMGWLEVCNLEVADINEMFFDAYVDALCEYKKNGGFPLSWNTVNARAAGAYRFLKWAVRNGYCEGVHIEDVENSYRSTRKKYTAKGHPAKKFVDSVKFLQLHDAVRFVEHLGVESGNLDSGISFRNKLMASLMLQAGLRVSEVVGYPLKDLPELNMRGHSTPARVVGKGMKERCVLIPNNLLLRLWEYVDFAREKIIESVEIEHKFLSSETLFLTERGQAISRNWIEKKFSQASKELGLKMTPHSLRHTFGTYHYLLNRDLAGLANLMGHASETTTRKYYVHTAMLVSYVGTYSAFQDEVDRLVGEVR